MACATRPWGEGVHRLHGNRRDLGAAGDAFPGQMLTSAASAGVAATVLTSARNFVRAAEPAAYAAARTGVTRRVSSSANRSTRQRKARSTGGAGSTPRPSIRPNSATVVSSAADVTMIA